MRCTGIWETSWLLLWLLSLFNARERASPCNSKTPLGGICTAAVETYRCVYLMRQGHQRLRAARCSWLEQVHEVWCSQTVWYAMPVQWEQTKGKSQKSTRINRECVCQRIGEWRKCEEGKDEGEGGRKIRLRSLHLPWFKWEDCVEKIRVNRDGGRKFIPSTIAR